MALVTRIGHIGLTVGEMDRMLRFYTEIVGMGVSERGSEGEKYLHLQPDHHCLILFPGAEPGCHHLAFQVEGQRGLDVARETLERHGLRPTEGAPEPGRGPAITFRDPDGRLIELYAAMAPAPRTGGGSLRPDRLQHVTIATPQVKTITAFYAEVLGFKISDWMGDRFSWLRCNTDHHSVAFIEDEHPRLDHIALEVSGWDVFKPWCDFLARRGVPITWGPGRHGAGNNLFIMFADPEVTMLEYSAELEQFWDEAVHYEPRHWSENSTGAYNLWGPLPSFRES